MPGASLVAAVVSPEVLEALPGDKEVFFAMLRLECGTTCTNSDGMWLLQGQWTQVKDAVSLLDIVEKSKNSNESLIDKAYFDSAPLSAAVSSQSKTTLQKAFVVEWSSFFKDIQKEFPDSVIEKFKRIVTSAVRKEEELKTGPNPPVSVPSRRPLTRRKGLPQRLKNTIVENPLATALANAFDNVQANNDAFGADLDAENIDDVVSIDSVDSVDIQCAIEENIDKEFSPKKQQGNRTKRAVRTGPILRRDGKSKSIRIPKRSADALNKLLRDLSPEYPASSTNPRDIVVATADTNNVRSSGDLMFAISETVFPSRSGDEAEDLTNQGDPQVGVEQPSYSELLPYDSNVIEQQIQKPVYRCPVCFNFTSETRGGIKIHAFASHLAASYRCFVCKGVYASKLALERHRVSHRQETFPYLKCICSRIMTSRSGLTRHIASCKALTLGARLIDDPSAADELEERIPPYITYNEQGHPKKAAGRPPQREQFICDICKSFAASTGAKLVHHKLTEHPNDALRCLSCPSLQFNNFAEFLDHNSLHLTKLPCDQCEKVFSNARTYEMHLRTHDSGFEKAAFVCTICAKAFATAYVLKYHMQHAHLNMGRRFQCSRCSRSFSQKIHLIEHLYSHDGLKPYMCEVCGKGFSHQTSLQQHKLTHGEEARYKCDECPKSFRTRASLLMHRNCHTERKHQCQYCGKLFTQKTARIRHERIHTGEQPFKCTACDKAFSDSSVLRRHMLTHDPNKKPVQKRSSLHLDTANAFYENAVVVDLTSAAPLPTPVAIHPPVPPKAPKPRAQKAKAVDPVISIKKTNQSIAKKNLPSSSIMPVNLPLAPSFATSSLSAFAPPPQATNIDSALDLHLFSPMSVLLQQQAMHGMVSGEQCPSPETPPPISVPDLQSVPAALECNGSDLSRYHQPQQPQNLAFGSQSHRIDDGESSANQQYVIQLAPETLLSVQMAPTSSMSHQSSRNVSKFSSYIHHQQQQQQQNEHQHQRGNGSAQMVLHSSHHQQAQQMYGLASSPQHTQTVLDLVGGPVLTSSNGTTIQPFFLSSDLSGNGGTVFAVPAEALFGLQSHQGGANSPAPSQSSQNQHHPPPSCSYQFSDMPLSLNDGQGFQSSQQQHQQESQILYQSASFFANMDGSAIPISTLGNIFTEQFSSSNNRQQQHLSNMNNLLVNTGDNDPQQQQPILQLPPPSNRTTLHHHANTHQQQRQNQISNNSNTRQQQQYR